MNLTNGGGASNGPRNVPFDRWFRYPAGFSPTALGAALQAVAARPGDLLIDPFVGAATGWRAGVEQGYRHAGIEVHPEIAELAKLKVKPFARPARIVDDARRVARDIAEADISRETDLVARSFDEDSLRELVSIRDQLKAHPRRATTQYLKWSLLGALRDCARVQVRWPYQRPAVRRKPRIAEPARAFLRRAEWMAADLSESSRDSAAIVLRGDARRLGDWVRVLGDEPADAVVTSPPYLNNFDYADATRLELYFWGVARTWSEMVERVRAGMLTASTQQARSAAASESMARVAAIAPHTASVLESLTSRLEAERRRRPRGKEYDRVIGPYFEGMSRVLVNMRKCVRPGARIALVVGDSAPYGVYVDTPGLLAQLAQELDLRLVNVSTIRPRGARWVNNGVRHQHALTERLVVLCSPGN